MHTVSSYQFMETEKLIVLLPLLLKIASRGLKCGEATMIGAKRINGGVQCNKLSVRFKSNVLIDSCITTALQQYVFQSILLRGEKQLTCRIHTAY